MDSVKINRDLSKMVDIAKQYFPGYSDQEYWDLLMGATAFPLSPVDETTKQLSEMSRKSGGDINLALCIADQETRDVEKELQMKKNDRKTFAFSKPYYTQFTPSPGEYDKVYCEICGSECIVERNQLGATQWAEAMSRHKHFYDRFTCPINNDEDENGLHSQIYRLKEDIAKCSSPTIREIMEKDLLTMLTQVKFKG